MKSLINLEAYSYKNLCDLEELLMHKCGVNFTFEIERDYTSFDNSSRVLDIEEWTIEGSSEPKPYLEVLRGIKKEQELYLGLKTHHVMDFLRGYIAVYILELPFEALPLYLNSPNGKVQKLIAFRLERGI